MQMSYHLAGGGCSRRLGSLLSVRICYRQHVCMVTLYHCEWRLPLCPESQCCTPAAAVNACPSVLHLCICITSSIAITTSTVSKLSSPRSFVKCDCAESCERCQSKYARTIAHFAIPLMGPEPAFSVSICPVTSLHRTSLTLSKFFNRSRIRPVTSS